MSISFIVFKECREKIDFDKLAEGWKGFKMSQKVELNDI